MKDGSLKMIYTRKFKLYNILEKVNLYRELENSIDTRNLGEKRGRINR